MCSVLRTILFINNKKRFKTPWCKCDLFFYRARSIRILQTRPKLLLSTTINQIVCARVTTYSNVPAQDIFPQSYIIFHFICIYIHIQIINILGAEKCFSCHNQYCCSSTTITMLGIRK